MPAAADRPTAPLHDRLLSFVRAFAGGTDGRITTLVADASTRRYHRVGTGGSPASVVVMELPSDAPPPVSPGVGPAGPSFIEVQRYLEQGGFPVPRVYRADLDAGLIALEDLGDRSLESAVREAPPAIRRRLYERAVSLVAELQRLGSARPDPGALPFRRRFDETILRWELEHFREWLLEKGRGVQLSPPESQTLDRGFGWLAGALAATPLHLVHRDFQSRNLMVVDGPDGPDLKVIDFQDALLGSQAYDLVALLRDSYVELPASEVHDLLALFAARAGIEDQVSLRNLFYMQTLQRKLKDAGRFVYLDRVRGNPSYLRWIPGSLRYAAEAMRALPPLADMAEILQRHVPELGGP